MQKLGKSKLNFVYNLQKYTSNEESIRKVSNFMIDYCLCLNNKSELYIDKELYIIHKEKMNEAQYVNLEDTNLQTDILVPSMKVQFRMASLIQSRIRGFLTRLNKSKTKLRKKIIYQTVVKISGISYLLKLMEWKMKSDQKYYFLYVQSKGENSNSGDEQNKFEFEAQNMKDYELSRETLNVLFGEFTKIDLLEDDQLQIDWEGFYKKMEQLEEFETEIPFKSMNL
mmetsp:Transcript_29002/g.25648  ORF Transcript_29002/g.25648 Transcript_29002/m.25648 type:complete len:226 (+) Transcript_29002:447-1124(+)